MEYYINLLIFFTGWFILYAIVTFNKLRKRSLRVKRAKSQIEIYLTQRFDLIPNLVECVKAYCNYEENLLIEVTKLRTYYNQNKNFRTGEELDKKYYELIALTENNPDLKASEQFLNLQKNLTKIESQIEAARRIYNWEVTEYNNTVTTFPANIFAFIFRFKEIDLFEADDRAKRPIILNIDKK